MTLQEIPKDTDVLITHTPPHGILDGAKRYGCELLRKTFDDGELQPIYHFFGHIHEGYGVLERDGTRFVNASTCDVRYRPVQAAVVVDL